MDVSFSIAGITKFGSYDAEALTNIVIHANI